VTMRFGLIGDGKISEKHKVAVSNNGGQVTEIYDPKYNDTKIQLDKKFFEDKDYIIICSPSNFHREHIKMALECDKKIIVEKPMVLPWEPIIDDNRVNVVLQLRWIDLPEMAEEVNVTMVRDQKYFKTWEGNAKLTGGLFYHLFIHYIDLAIKLKSKFVGNVISKGVQVRMIDDLDILKLDVNDLYIKMYNDIINEDGGVKPSELFYIYWVLERCGWKYGINSIDLMNEELVVDFSNGVSI